MTQSYAHEIAKIREFAENNPTVSPSVLSAIILYLEHGRVEDARWKVQFDSDKFTSSKMNPVLRFFDSIGLISPEYRRVLVRWQGWEETP